MKLKPGTFHETTWDAVRLEVKKIAHDIFNVIEDMSPDSSYKLYEVTYPYGAFLATENNLIIPVADGWQPITSSKVDSKIKNELTPPSTNGCKVARITVSSFFTINTTTRIGS